MRGADVLSRFVEGGYSLALDSGELAAAGPAPPSEELRALAAENRAVLKAAVLIASSPSWLTKLFELYRSAHETPVRRTNTTGKAEVFMVSVSIKNVCAAVAAEIGMPVLEWERLRPEVEEALRQRGSK